MRFFLAALVSALLLVAGCTSSEEPAESPSSPSSSPTTTVTDDSADDTPTPEDSILSGIGTVQYVNLEGGFYGIVDEETGQKYNPDAIPDSLQIDGITVEYRARPRNVMTIQMWGRPIEIISIEQVD